MIRQTKHARFGTGDVEVEAFLQCDTIGCGHQSPILARALYKRHPGYTVEMIRGRLIKSNLNLPEDIETPKNWTIQKRGTLIERHFCHGCGQKIGS